MLRSSDMLEHEGSPAVDSSAKDTEEKYQSLGKRPESDGRSEQEERYRKLKEECKAARDQRRKITNQMKADNLTRRLKEIVRDPQKCNLEVLEQISAEAEAFMSSTYTCDELVTLHEQIRDIITNLKTTGSNTVADTNPSLQLQPSSTVQECALRIRLDNGSILTETFTSSQTLLNVHEKVAQSRGGDANFSLILQGPPSLRREFTLGSPGMECTLMESNLYPNGSLIVQALAKKDVIRKASAGAMYPAKLPYGLPPRYPPTGYGPRYLPTSGGGANDNEQDDDDTASGSGYFGVAAGAFPAPPAPIPGMFGGYGGRFSASSSQPRQDLELDDKLRVLAETMESRSGWQSTQDAGESHLFAASAEETATIKRLFEQSMGASLTAVHRVENTYQLEAFTHKKKAVTTELSRKDIAWSEATHAAWAFHGTQDKNIENIVSSLSTGFMPVRSGSVHGCVYGNGTYLARQAATSYAYASIRADGKRRLILARVIVGLAKRANPLRYPAPPPGFHTLVDHVDRPPDVYVVPDGASLYPAYVLTVE